jgi:DNA polymerase elongation subunit (family B)
MSMIVFTDIETLPPDKNDLARFPKVCECSEEQFRKLALTGDYGRVLTIGVIVERDGEVVHEGCLGRDRVSRTFHLDEKRTLRGFWQLLKAFNPSRDLIVTHNGISFDLPFLYKRSVIHRVKPTVMLSFARYRSQPLFDTMHEWNKWDMKKFISLDELAGILSLASSKKDGMDGAHVYDRFCEGCHEQIADYCMADVRLTRSIYYRMVQPDGPEPLE